MSCANDRPAPLRLWVFLWLVYLTPLILIALWIVLGGGVASMGDCRIGARTSDPCFVFGIDWGGLVYSLAFSEHLIALFVLPWSVAGGLILVLVWALIRMINRTGSPNMIDD